MHQPIDLERSAPNAASVNTSARLSTVVAVITTSEADRQGLQEALAEAGLSVICHQVTDRETLRSIHDNEGLGLVVLWSPRSPVADDVLREMIGALPTQPPLLIGVDRIGPQAYTQAGALGAEDVISIRWLGQLELAVKRTLQTRALRQQLARAREQLNSNRIVDRSTFDETPALDAIPPLVGVIDEALRNNHLKLYFQPVVAVDDDDVNSYEVFVRLRHQGRDMLPEEFLPLAARYGLMPALDRWVVRNAVRRFKDEKRAREASATGLRFFLNVSAHTLVEERAAESLLKLIAQARPKSGEFVIKIDKNTLLTRLAPAKTLNRLVKMVGLQFAVDHYEHSDNQLNFLKHVAIDYIKLHGSMTHEIDWDAGKRRKVEEVIASARSNGIRVIAGQVERATELATLYSLGVDYVQGFQVAPPSIRLESLSGEE